MPVVASSHKFERLPVGVLAGISYLMMSGCSESQQIEEPEAMRRLPLMLSISERQDWLVVSIANKSPRPVSINGLMRPGGKNSELAFFFDGKPAAINTDTHYFTMPPVESEPAVELGAEKTYGTIIRKEHIPSMFVFPKGSCKEVQVIYQDSLGVDGAFSGELASNKLELCL